MLILVFEVSEKFKGLSDEVLASMYKGGSQEAFNELFVRYLSVIRKKALDLSGTGIDHDDLFQEGLIGLHSAARSYCRDGGAGFGTYADICIRNRMISAVRSANSSRNSLNNAALPLTEDHNDIAAPDSDPDDILIAGEELREFSKKLRDALSEQEKRVLALYIEGKTYKEISDCMGITVKSCSNAMQRARKKLRDLR